MGSKLRRIIGAGTTLLGFAAIGMPSQNSGNPYQSIPERNIFGLKEPPPVQVTNNEPAPALPKLYLTGITTILGNKLVFLTLQHPAQQGQAAKEEALTLAEGQRDAGVELLRVDEVGKKVIVNNSGTQMTLDFDNNGAKPSTVAANGTVPGVPGSSMPAPAQPSPTAQPSAGVAASTPAIPAPTFPSQVGTLRRSLRLPNPPTTTVNPPPSNAALGGPAAAARQQAAGTAGQLTPQEEQILKALGDNGTQVSPQ